MSDETPAQVWYLYLIECEDGSLYTGITTDVERRYAQHIAGKGARYTRMKKPVRLLGFRECGTRSSALKAELAMKRLPPANKQAALSQR
ncbi:MAG TPA: GIY-YIG nuclease family protein [Rhodocyclaceae bacterium]|nr:GIY-YIG nuclease family protein [Rhodocyclaceae bacterium]